MTENNDEEPDINRIDDSRREDKPVDCTQPHDSQTTELEAMEWFTRLNDEPVSASVRLTFLNWRAAKPENRQAYDQIAALWKSDVFASALKMDQQRLASPPGKKRFIGPGLAVAASMLLSIWGVLQTGWLDRLRADAFTPVGQQQTLTLADGSIIILDTDSAVRVSYQKTTRRVTLLSGRAFFNVQTDASRPFIVNTDDERIRVVGTRFTVSKESKTPLTVQHGIVTYRNHRIGRDQTVKAGEQLNKSTTGVTVADIDSQTTAFAWLNGRMKFSGRPLAEVIAEIDRYQPGVILIGKPALAGLQVTGSYKLDHPEKILASLAQATGAKVVHLSAYLTVLY